MKRGRRAALALMGILAGLVLVSCDPEGDLASTLRGNERHRAGRYEEAAAAYLAVRGGAWKALVDYNLANSWARLGEEKAAEALYGAVLREGDPRQRRLAWFNLGVLRYEKGRFEQAYGAFKEALRLDAADGSARRNLEIAWRAWQKEGSEAAGGLSPTTRASGEGRAEDLRLLRRLETGTWRPASGGTEPPGGRDY